MNTGLNQSRIRGHKQAGPQFLVAAAVDKHGEMAGHGPLVGRHDIVWLVEQFQATVERFEPERRDGLDGARVDKLSQGHVVGTDAVGRAVEDRSGDRTAIEHDAAVAGLDHTPNRHHGGAAGHHAGVHDDGEGPMPRHERLVGGGGPSTRPRA
jgi:hypothetical protein